MTPASGAGANANLDGAADAMREVGKAEEGRAEERAYAEAAAPAAAMGRRNILKHGTISARGVLLFAATRARTHFVAHAWKDPKVRSGEGAGGRNIKCVDTMPCVINKYPGTR
jgi:hypothetical protein